MGHALSQYALAASACVSRFLSFFCGLCHRAAMAIASTISLVLIIYLTITPLMIKRRRKFPYSMSAYMCGW
jgi:hypothetical protein